MAIAAINPNQDYDIIYTLTFARTGAQAPLHVQPLNYDETPIDIHYREGTSGPWTTVTGAFNSHELTVTSTTMQVAHDTQRTGSDVINLAFYEFSDDITEIRISQQAPFSGSLPSLSFAHFASMCENLTHLDVFDVSGVTSVENGFMNEYARQCTSLTSLEAPYMPLLEFVEHNFLESYAHGNTNLTSLEVPDFPKLETVGGFFMSRYAAHGLGITSLKAPYMPLLESVGDGLLMHYATGNTNLTSLEVPDFPKLETVGDYFMEQYASDDFVLEKLILPDPTFWENNPTALGVDPSLQGTLKGEVSDPDDLDRWKDLTGPGGFLALNYITDPDNVEAAEVPEPPVEPKPPVDSFVPKIINCVPVKRRGGKR